MLEHKRFTGKTRAEVEEAAERWWATQSGLVRLSEFSGPLALDEQTHDRWAAVIIFERR